MNRSIARLVTAASLALPLALVQGCGGSSDPKALTDEGMTALSSGDYEGASQKLADALAGMEASDMNYARAMMGKVKADLRSNAGQAKDDFLAYAKANTSTVSADDFSSIGQAFASASKYSEAIDILDAGMKTHSESPVLAKLQEIIKSAAEKAGDSAALDKMAGLGYL